MSKTSLPQIGLVLSGGGVRGVAHLGVLKVLEECGLSPTLLSGTSAGALVGGLYAAGHSIETILDFFKKTPIFSLSNLTARKPGVLDSERYIPILKEYLPEDSFESLQKKLYVTATDIIHGKSKTFSSGELIRPIVASAAVPVVFSPVLIGDNLYTDGGALNNFPVEPLTGRCDAIIGVSVHPLKEINPAEIKTTFAVMERIFHLTVFHHSVQKFHLCNLVIAPQALSKFGTLDRGHFDEIYQIGYEAAQGKREEFLSLLSNQ